MNSVCWAADSWAALAWQDGSWMIEEAEIPSLGNLRTRSLNGIYRAPGLNTYRSESQQASYGAERI